MIDIYVYKCIFLLNGFQKNGAKFSLKIIFDLKFIKTNL